MSAVLRPAPEPVDFITILKTLGKKLAKTFDGDKVIPFDDAKQYTIETQSLNSIDDLEMTLRYLGPKSLRCVIRGEFKGDAAAQTIAPPTRPGYYRRISELFNEVPHHWAMLDIDEYFPMLYDPTADTEQAIQEFVEDKLPSEFHNATYIWQLSSSSGRVSGKLKCHLWVWLQTPYTGTQLRAWIQAGKLKPKDMLIDDRVMLNTQCHYTANPVFVNGAVDPIAPGRRLGLRRGATDEVDLIIPEDVICRARDRVATSGTDLDLTDPTQKPGVIGAFCKAYPISRVISEVLPEEFVFVDSDDARSVTWLNSDSGQPRGCWVTPDDWHFGNIHNGSPHSDRLVNAWDMVRIYKFGHLDADLTLDEQALAGIGDLPSQRAMRAWAKELPEVKGVVSDDAQSARDGFLAGIRGAADERTLRKEVLPAIAREGGLAKTDRDILTAAILARMRDLTGVRNLGIAFARGMLRDAGREEINTEAPFWVAPLVYVTNGDLFFNLDTKEHMTRQGFDFSYNRFMTPFMNEDGITPVASRHACDVWHMPTVSNLAYNPTLDRMFERFGRMFANTYSSANIPAVPPVMTDAEEAAIRLVEAHTTLLLPDERERTLFLDFLAHQVQFPGRKVRWAVFMHGAPGAGKTFYQQLLASAMGPDNVKPLNANTLLKSDFNEWANGAAFVVVEEIKVPRMSAREADNKLKAPITNPDIEIHPKGKASYVVVNVTNYLILSNFPDGLPMDDLDRRYMTLRAAISAAMAKKLSEEGYFVRLFDAVEAHGGAMRKWLLERKFCPEFSANGHAPWTTEKGRVIELSKSETQTAMEDLIEEGCLGVTKQVISTAHLSQAVKDKTGEKIWTSQVQRRLEEAGFKKHGRVKWGGDWRTIYVLADLVHSLPTVKEEVNAVLRKLLDESKDSKEFLD